MKQSKIKALTKRDLAISLSRIDEEKCPTLFKILREIVRAGEKE